MKLFASFALVFVLLLVHDSTAYPRPCIKHLVEKIFGLDHNHGRPPQPPLIIMAPPFQPQQYPYNPYQLNPYQPNPYQPNPYQPNPNQLNPLQPNPHQQIQIN